MDSIIILAHAAVNSLEAEKKILTRCLTDLKSELIKGKIDKNKLIRKIDSAIKRSNQNFGSY